MQKAPCVTSKLQGSGAEFKLERTSANVITVTLDGKVLDTYTMDGVTADNKVVSVGFKQYGNPKSSNYTVEVPYVATYARAVVSVKIANMTNGKVTADKTSCRIGDKVVFTIAPNSGYSYKTFKVNGKSVTPTTAGKYKVLGNYLTRIEKVYGVKYSRCLATYEGKINLTSLLYRSDKLKVVNSGIKVFSWWKDKAANYNYHMRNISRAHFAFLNNTSKKFIVANTHWSYRLEHAEGNTYLTGSSKPIVANELRTQCMNETKDFMASLKKTYSDSPIFLTGDFNTSLPFFTQSTWTPTSFNVISEQAKTTVQLYQVYLRPITLTICSAQEITALSASS
ncbi:MAG: hypothetical protein IKL21_03620 [Clostridia bacterium]|nr:hypothetical protein [Clostridia bacterium]